MNAKDLKNILSVLPDEADISIEIWRHKKLDTRSHVSEVVICSDMDHVTIVGEFKDETE